MRYHEIMLFELNNKVKENLRFKFKRENENLTDAQIDYYLDRWDRYVNNFELQYRDITRLTFSQVEALIDEAETSAQLKGKSKNLPKFDQNDDLIYNKNNLVILKGDLREKCIQYGSGYSWCISRSDASNMFYSYRMRMNEPMFYFVFDKDLPDTNIWHAVVIYVDNRNIFHVATSNNLGDVQMTWDEIVSKKPKLSGLETLFVHQALTADEKSDYNKYKKEVDLTTYSNYSLKEKYKYIQFGHKLSDDQQDATPNELIGVYAKQMPINISSNTWNRLGGSDRRKVEEGRIQAVRQDGRAIKYIKNPSEEVQLAAVQQYVYAIGYIKNPSEEVQLAAVQQDVYAIGYIKNPSEEVQLAAVQQDVYAIGHIKNPSEEVQLAAVRQYGNAIGHIKNPSEEVQLAAVRQYGNTIYSIKNPSEEVQLAAVRQNGIALEYIKNPSEEVQLAAVRQNGNAIYSIKNPSEEVQLAAVQQDGNAIEYIKNPSERVRQLAAKRNQL